MPGSSSSRVKYSIGHSVGSAMAKRIVDLAHPDAIIVDNRPTVLIERRKPNAPRRTEITPRRRSTDVQSDADQQPKSEPPSGK